MKSSFDELASVFVIALFTGLGWGVAITLILTK